MKFRFHDQIDRTRRWVEAKEKRALFYGGAYARRGIKSSLRLRTKKGRLVDGGGRDKSGRFTAGARVFSSAPGQPPRITWPKSPLKHLMAFGVDLRRGSVVVGPLLFKPAWRSSRPDPGTTVPAVLESGGTVTTPRGDVVRIEPRPYLQPKLKPATDKMLEVLRS